MSQSDFQPEKRTIEELFVGTDYFVIPRFQRPYSWDAENLDEFWRDVVYDNTLGYFIGPMVAWREPNSPNRRIVDGQQRITTITILLAVLRDTFRTLKEEKLADGIHRYLEKADRDNELRFTLRTESPSRFLSQAVFRNPPEPLNPATEEEESISKAKTNLLLKINAEIEKRLKPVDWLKEVRNRLLGLMVIWIEHSDEDDAYVIFETLNSRGKNLEVVDLLKNLLLNMLRSTSNSDADAIRAKWEEMLKIFEATATRKRLDTNRFILHWWLSKEEYVAERKLFPVMRKRINNQATASEQLDSLLKDATHYRSVMDPDSMSHLPHEKNIKRGLMLLKNANILQPAPLLLSLKRAREAKPKLSNKQYRQTIETIENFHFLHTVVSRLRSSGGTSEMYAKAARDLYGAQGDGNISSEVLTALRKKLIDRKPDRDQFLLAFVDRFVYTRNNTRDQKIVKYVLERLLEAVSPAVNAQDFTIEHILPQKEISQGISETTIGSLGNLVLLPGMLNEQLDDKNFQAKKKILLKSGAEFLITDITQIEEWSQTEILERGHKLAELAYDKVWRLPVMS